ncbi:MAG TPA: hypothetical protein VFS21_14235 [Roseiflexaceae bacterium]|nr:hypothetical protein [Roseiflexaceae bacterium]
MIFTDLLQIVQILALCAIVVALPLRWSLKQRAELRRTKLRAELAEAEVQELQQQIAQISSGLSTTERERVERVRNGPQPMDSPPAGIEPTYQRLLERWPDDPYAFPIGWERSEGRPALVCASANPESPMWTGNILLTGKTRFGKDMLAFLMLWTLCRRNSPERLRIYYIDGKQSDGALWAGLGLAHNLHEPVLGEEGIGMAMVRLRELRKTRERQRVELRVTKWSEIPVAQRPPLVVVFVSELDLLELGCPRDEKLEDWLAKELASALASGIMYIVGAQTVSNRNTRWRQQCLTFIAGFQDVEVAVEPNIGMPSKELEKLGGMSPVQFPGPGYFTARINRSVVTVRAPRLDLPERRAAVEQLPRLPARPPQPALPSQPALPAQPAQATPARSRPARVANAAAVARPEDQAFLAAALSNSTAAQTAGQPEQPAPPPAAASAAQAAPDETDTAARRATLEAALARGETLAPDQIIFLHRAGWSLNRLVEAGAVRGSKTDRRKRIAAILAAQENTPAPVSAKVAAEIAR